MQDRNFTGAALVILFLLAVSRGQRQTFSTITAQERKAAPVDAALDCAVIDRLDRCVQQRFSQADKVFGFYRMLPTTLYINHFVPNTPAERAAVTELEQAGWRMGFYLAGRRVLGPTPDLTKFVPRMHDEQHPIINGPLAITSSHAQGRKQELIENFGFPAPAALWEQAQQAMHAFDRQNQYDFKVGKWQVTARPIRAMASCLACHNDNHPVVSNPLRPMPEPRPVKVGDALGIALYAYRRAQ